MTPLAVDILDLPTPSWLVERGAFDRNIATMAARWPGTQPRPHAKAFRSTALAKTARRVVVASSRRPRSTRVQTRRR